MALYPERKNHTYHPTVATYFAQPHRTPTPRHDAVQITFYDTGHFVQNAAHWPYTSLMPYYYDSGTNSQVLYANAYLSHVDISIRTYINHADGKYKSSDPGLCILTQYSQLSSNAEHLYEPHSSRTTGNNRTRLFMAGTNSTALICATGSPQMQQGAVIASNEYACNTSYSIDCWIPIRSEPIYAQFTKSGTVAWNDVGMWAGLTITQHPDIVDDSTWTIPS